ncbi:MarR family winged helix-turn-helix transcriptional regulator [Nakamurella panacisegetis]|nr:MarR family transcriptional regulator [Nakamurella panacisegetis]
MASRGTTSPNETDVPWLSSAEETAWIGLMAIVSKLPAALDGQLQRDSGIGRFEYSVLSWLSMSEGRMLRMSTLAELANGSLSRLSNVVKRLEQQNFMRREPDPTDGRYTVAQLTDAGWDCVVAAAPGHVRAVRHFVFDVLTAAEVDQLGQIGRKVGDRLRTDLPSVACTEAGAEPVC